MLFRSLFRLLCRHNLLSTKQIQHRVFDGLELTTVMRRLRKLQAGGFLVRLGMLPCRTWVWGCSTLANELFSGFASSSRTNLHTMNHDVQLAELRFLFEELVQIEDWFDIRHIVHDALPPGLKRDFCRDSYDFKKGEAALTPDALFIGRKKNVQFNCALELELSIKASNRYRKILNHYSYKRDLKTILYVVENDHIRHAIESNARLYIRKDEYNIYTVRRQDLFKARDNAVLQNTRDGSDRKSTRLNSSH